MVVSSGLTVFRNNEYFIFFRFCWDRLGYFEIQVARFRNTPFRHYRLLLFYHKAILFEVLSFAATNCNTESIPRPSLIRKQNNNKKSCAHNFTLLDAPSSFNLSNGIFAEIPLITILFATLSSVDHYQ